MENKDFDKLISDGLNNIESTDPKGWDALARKLDAEDAANLFDDTARETLESESIDLPGSELAWGNLAASLGKIDAQNFDANIGEKTKRVQSSASDHWILLAEQLRNRANNRSTYIRLKSLELIAFLLIFTYFNIGYSDNDQSRQISNIATANEQKQVLKESSSSLNDPSSSHLSDEKGIANTSAVNTTEIGSNERNHLHILEIIPTKNASISYKPLHKKVSLVSFNNSVAKIEVPSPVLDNAQELFVEATIAKKTKKSSLSLGVYGSYDLHNIYSPLDTDFGDKPYRRTESGFGGGIQVGVHLGKWTVSSGFDYSHRQYEPAFHVEEYAYTHQRRYFKTDQLKSISLNVLSVPLHLRRTVVTAKKWNFYALGGGAIHVVTLAGYEREAQNTDTRFLPPSTSQPVTQPPVLSPDPTNNITEETTDVSNISKKEYTPGLFEGGHFKQTSYLTYQIGAGIEFVANPNLRIFNEPVYQGLISDKGFGPTQDRTNTLSFRTGIRVLLP